MRTHAFMNHLVQSNRYNVQWATALRPSRLAAAGTLERFSSRLQWGAPWPPCAASVNPENHLWGWRWRPYHLRLATFRRVWCLWSMPRTFVPPSLVPVPVMNGKQETRNFVGVTSFTLATLLARSRRAVLSEDEEDLMKSDDNFHTGDKFGMRKKGTKILDWCTDFVERKRNSVKLVENFPLILSLNFILFYRWNLSLWYTLVRFLGIFFSSDVLALVEFF